MNLFEMNMKMGDASDGLILDEDSKEMSKEWDKFKKKKKGDCSEDEENEEEEEDD